MYGKFGISEELVNLSREVEKEVRDELDKIERIREYNQLKVIKAMQDNGLSDTHFCGSTGYGYSDRGREVLDEVYADVFKAEKGLVRHQIVSGTHALSLVLFGLLRTKDELLVITGKPYDTMEEVIGIRGEGMGSLSEFGVLYKQVDLKKDGSVDIDKVCQVINEKTKVVMIQRSRGYEWRDSLSIDDIEYIVSCIKKKKNDVIVFVDNCYGEFVEKREPIEVGVDIVAGSLIKNPGGGLALTGGYIVGKAELVEKVAYRLTAPGIGNEIGASLGNNRLMFQGLFLAPHIVSEAMKGAVFTAKMMEKIGVATSPASTAKRSDIIQAMKFENKEELIAFCQGIQKGSPVDSFVVPMPWDMPGYDNQVIMAAGTFVQGSSIELSADAPIKEPYIVFMQGGLVYEHVKLGVMIAISKLRKRSLGHGED
ncbi:MAG: aminotransferase class I/II-fold pyridoxal phosphate-dependent enzyme [Clostridiales bacterium]|nr:aminotransferase class I/II-fold pyridoxal phosphate-dependent enzyme [Clostridiales bacterium]